MAAKMEEGKAMKNQVKSNDPTQQTMTINFVPEKQRYSKPTNIEEYIRTYFEGINGINRRIIAEERKIISQNRNTWQNLSIEERDKLLNDRHIASDIRQKYKTNDEYWREKTPWQHEALISSDDLQVRHERTDSISMNDSFSKPFQWATKSQRNLKFPVIKQEKLKTEQPQPKQSTSRKMKEVKKLQDEDDTEKKKNNVEQSIKEKQIKTTNENIKGNVESNKTGKSSMLDDKPKILTTENNEVFPNENSSTSEQPNGDGNEYMDGSTNIFEFLQSWDP